MKSIWNTVRTFNFILGLSEAAEEYQGIDLSQSDSTEDGVIELDGADRVIGPALSGTELFVLSVVLGASHQEAQSRGLDGSLQLGDKSDHLNLAQDSSGDIDSYEADSGLLLGSEDLDLDEDLSNDIDDEESKLFDGSKSEAVPVDWNLIINIAILSGFLKSLLQAVGLGSGRDVANDRRSGGEKSEVDQGVNEYIDEKSEVDQGESEYVDEDKGIGRGASEYIYKVLICLQNAAVRLISRGEGSYIDGKIMDRPRRREALLGVEDSAGSIVGRGEREVAIGDGLAGFLNSMSNAVLHIIVDGGPSDRQIFTVDIGELGRGLNLSGGVRNVQNKLGQSVGRREMLHDYNSDLLMRGDGQGLTAGAVEGLSVKHINKLLQTIVGAAEVDRNSRNAKVSGSQTGLLEGFQPTVDSRQFVLEKDSQADHRAPYQKVPQAVSQKDHQEVGDEIGEGQSYMGESNAATQDRGNNKPLLGRGIGPSRGIGSSGQHSGDSNSELEEGLRSDTGKNEEGSKKKSSGWSGSWRSFGSRCIRMFLKALSVAAECWRKAKEWVQKNTRNKVDPEESFASGIRDKTDSELANTIGMIERGYGRLNSQVDKEVIVERVVHYMKQQELVLAQKYLVGIDQLSVLNQMNNEASEILKKASSKNKVGLHEKIGKMASGIRGLQKVAILKLCKEKFSHKSDDKGEQDLEKWLQEDFGLKDCKDNSKLEECITHIQKYEGTMDLIQIKEYCQQSPIKDGNSGPKIRI